MKIEVEVPDNIKLINLTAHLEERESKNGTLHVYHWTEEYTRKDFKDGKVVLGDKIDEI